MLDTISWATWLRRWESARLFGFFLVVSIAAVISPATGDPSVLFDPPLSPRIANYDIHVALNDQARTLDGRTILTWKNPSDDAIDELRFHLYWNAFKNGRSTFSHEGLFSSAFGSRSGRPSEFDQAEEDGWGWIRITRMSLDGVDVTDRVAFVAPDDGNELDETVARITLPAPIPPRATAKIEMTFSAKIPRCIVRSGWWQDDFFMMAQWFPKIGVYETPGQRFLPKNAPKGKWNCPQFHAATEFYSDYGVYDVEITLPRQYIVGTSGVIVEERDVADGKKVVVAHAEDVHDFAWVADAQFLERRETWRNPATNRDVAIRLLYQPGHGAFADKYISAVKGALDHVERWLGPSTYPYPTITIVDPRSGSGAGGMEYPNLFTGGGYWWVDAVFNDGVRMVEGVTIHEFMHQIWYGIVGNNEFEEAWLDEGLTTYSEMRIMSELYGKDSGVADWWGLRASPVGLGRSGYIRTGSRLDGTMADPTYSHWRTGVGPMFAYIKTSLMLTTLENHVGRETIDRIFQSYYRNWRFKHPCRNDFIAEVENALGSESIWTRFIRESITKDSVLDYAVAAIANVSVEASELGYLGPDGSILTKDEEEDEDESPKAFHSRVVVRRNGEMILPVEVLVEFDDGETVRESWDGVSRIKEFEYSRSARVTRASVDPDRKTVLDINWLNNSILLEPDAEVTNKYTAKGLFWMQNLLQWFSILN